MWRRGILCVLLAGIVNGLDDDGARPAAGASGAERVFPRQSPDSEPRFLAETHRAQPALPLMRMRLAVRAGDEEVALRALEGHVVQMETVTPDEVALTVCLGHVAQYPWIRGIEIQGPCS